MVEIPMKAGKNFTAGLQYQAVESDASITSKPGTTQEIIARRERFDKDVGFKMVSLTGMLGFTF